MEFKASAKFVKTTPDKARILTKLVMGKKPEESITQLQFCGRDAAKYIILVIKQANDQVKSKGLNLDDFTIKEYRVDEGPKLKRRRIVHQGRATAILKRMAHLTIILTDNGKSKVKVQDVKEKAIIEKDKTDKIKGSK